MNGKLPHHFQQGVTFPSSHLGGSGDPRKDPSLCWRYSAERSPHHLQPSETHVTPLSATLSACAAEYSLHASCRILHYVQLAFMDFNNVGALKRTTVRSSVCVCGGGGGMLLFEFVCVQCSRERLGSPAVRGWDQKERLRHQHHHQPPPHPPKQVGPTAEMKDAVVSLHYRTWIYTTWIQIPIGALTVLCVLVWQLSWWLFCSWGLSICTEVEMSPYTGQLFRDSFSVTLLVNQRLVVIKHDCCIFLAYDLANNGTCKNPFILCSVFFFLLLPLCHIYSLLLFHSVSCQNVPAPVSPRQIPAFYYTAVWLTDRRGGSVWTGLTLFPASLWKWANSLRSWMLVSCFHSSNTATPSSTTTEADSTAVISVTSGPDGHSWETRGSHSSSSETDCRDWLQKCVSARAALSGLQYTDHLK